MRPFHPHRLWCGLLQFFQRDSEKFGWHNPRAAGGRDGGGKVDDLSVLGEQQEFFAELSSAISKDLSPNSSHIVAWTRRRWRTGKTGWRAPLGRNGRTQAGGRQREAGRRTKAK